MKSWIGINLILLLGFVADLRAQQPVPDKLVVLTFDDSVRSHYTIVRPILKEFGFGATFFITEGFEFQTDKENYMTWEQIAELDHAGFEIGNHTRDHVAITEANYKEQLQAINDRCEEYAIPKPTSFAFPGNKFSAEMIPWLKDMGIQFARRGGTPEFDYDEGRGVAVEPGSDHPLLLPTAADARPDWGDIHCPCLHSDPQFDDLEPGENQTIQGWLSFYEGRDVYGEMGRLRKQQVLTHVGKGVPIGTTY